jgi:hypothetical protein
MESGFHGNRDVMGAVLIGAVGQFLIAMVWYAPQLFGNK